MTTTRTDASTLDTRNPAHAAAPVQSGPTPLNNDEIAAVSGGLSIGLAPSNLDDRKPAPSYYGHIWAL